jgi:citrate lyase beta subunit
MSLRRRSYLFAPADDPAKLVKAASSEADCVIFELEDGVALDRKEQARTQAATALGTLDCGNRLRVLRINARSTPYYEPDVHVLAVALPDIVMLPKVESAADIAALASRLNALGAAASEVGIIALIESPLGCMNLREIAQQSPRLAGLVFGAEDYAAAAGCVRTASGHEVLTARTMVAMAAAAYGVQPIDQVFTNMQDADGLASDCRLGRELGFTGKMVIHPRQLSTVNAAFAPTPGEVEHAQRVLRAFEEAKARGAGAFSLDGKMVDAPVIKQARQILNLLN